MKELTCIICPRGCHLKIDDNLEVTGNNCPRGKDYAIKEITNPVRVLTSTVKIISETETRLPVKTKDAINKNLIFEAMKEVKNIVVKAPIKIGDIICENIAYSGVDLIATKNILK